MMTRTKALALLAIVTLCIKAIVERRVRPRSDGW